MQPVWQFILPCFGLALAAWTAEWEVWKDRGNRFEGLVRTPVGKPDIELLSFTGFQENFASDVNLRVRFFLPSSGEASIEARELAEDKQYLMRSKPSRWVAGWNEFSPWPTRDVLRPAEVASSNLGVAVRLGTAWAPAFVFHSTMPAACGAYVVYFRPNVTLASVNAGLWRQDGGRERLVRRHETGAKPAGVPFSLELDVRGLPEGSMNLVLEMRRRNYTVPLAREYRFYHKPLAP